MVYCGKVKIIRVDIVFLLVLPAGKPYDLELSVLSFPLMKNRNPINDFIPSWGTFEALHL